MWFIGLDRVFFVLVVMLIILLLAYPSSPFSSYYSPPPPAHPPPRPSRPFPSSSSPPSCSCSSSSCTWHLPLLFPLLRRSSSCPSSSLLAPASPPPSPPPRPPSPPPPDIHHPMRDLAREAAGGAQRRVPEPEATTNVQEAPKTAQERSRTLSGLKTAQEASKTSHEGPKRTLKRAPRGQLYVQYEFNLIAFSVWRAAETALEAPKITPKRRKRPRIGSRDGPKGPQDGPRGHQDDPNTGPAGLPRSDPSSPVPEDDRKSLHRGPPTYEAPRCPPEAPKSPNKLSGSPQKRTGAFREASKRPSHASKSHLTCCPGTVAGWAEVNYIHRPLCLPHGCLACQFLFYRFVPFQRGSQWHSVSPASYAERAGRDAPQRPQTNVSTKTSSQSCIPR